MRNTFSSSAMSNMFWIEPKYLEGQLGVARDGEFVALRVVMEREVQLNIVTLY